MPGSVIVGGARTPIGKLAGSLKDFSAMELGGFAIKAALERAGITGDQVDYVIMGHVIQAGAGQITARQAAVKAGIPMSVPAVTVNKVCLSGLNAIAMADQLIGYGEFDVVVAGGMESMTQGPYLLPRPGAGTGTVTMRSSTPPRTTRSSAPSTSWAWARRPRRTRSCAASAGRSRTPTLPGRMAGPLRRRRTACSMTRS
jgi:acetyl-CoA acetyltransferase